MLVVLIATLFSVDARACSEEGHTYMSIGESPDGVAPPTPEVLEVTMWRSAADTGDCADGTSTFTVTLTNPGMSRDEYGYRMTLAGDLPSEHFYTEPVFPLERYGDDLIVFSWADDDLEASIDATLTITAIDLDGDESAAVEVALSHPGVDLDGDVEDTGSALDGSAEDTTGDTTSADKRACGTPLDAGAVWLLAMVGVARRRRSGGS